MMVYTLFTRQERPRGYATIVILNCFMFAILFLIVGIIGEYIAILFSAAEGPANLYRGRNTECGEEICVKEKKIRRDCVNPADIFL
ncbi:MAG: hypothetical protein ACLUD2_03105 [Clostridium sp.]